MALTDILLLIVIVQLAGLIVIVALGQAEMRKLPGLLAAELDEVPPPFIAVEPATPEANPDRLVAAPPSVEGDSVKDWLQHYTHGKHTWGEAVAEFYRRASGDAEIADYFRGVDMERLQRHFTAAMIMVTGGAGLRQRTVDRMVEAHADVRNSFGTPITGRVYDRVVGMLVGILAEWGVPDEAIGELADVIDPLRKAIVQEPGDVRLAGFRG